jgi:hypothetical protein
MRQGSVGLVGAITLIAFTGGVWVTGHSFLPAPERVPAQPVTPPGANADPPGKDAKDADAKDLVESSPFALVHDFGKVPRGTIAKHTFRFINTSNAPLRVISLRIH